MAYGQGRGGRPWRRLRDSILKRDAYLCQPCARRGRLTAAQQVDHRIALCNGGTDADDNLEAICLKCHAHKTRMDQLGKATGCDMDGTPDDPGHPWQGEG